MWAHPSRRTLKNVTSLARLVPLVVMASLTLLVFSMGLSATFRELRDVVRRPSVLASFVFVLYVLVPLSAITLAIGLDPPDAVKITMFAISLSPVMPLFPRKLRKAGGGFGEGVALLAASSIFAVLVAPPLLALVGRLFEAPLTMPVAATMKRLALTVLLPLGLGLTVRQVAPARAKRLAKPLSIAGLGALVVALVPILLSLRGLGGLFGHRAVLALVVFIAAGIVAGEVLGGEVPRDRLALSLAAGARHPSVAITIAHASYPDEPLVVPAVLLYTLLTAVVVTLWQKRRVRRTAPA